MLHANAMTELYRNLTKMVAENCDDMVLYQPLFDKATGYSAWYKARKKVAASMKAAAAPSA